MSKAPAFQFYAKDFLTDTQTWTEVEVAVHTRLLAWSWVNGGVPTNFEEMCRISPSAKKVWARVGTKWEERDGMFFNAKLEECRDKQRAFAERQKEKSARGVAARKHHATISGQPTGQPTGYPADNPFGDRSNTTVRKERAKPAEGFDEFYLSYPNKKARGAAEAAWGKLKPEERALCKAAIEAQVRAHHFRGTDGNNYVPHPASWLNARRWMDEVTAAAPVLVNGKPRQMSKAEALVIINELRQKHGKDFQTHHIPADVYAAYREQRA